MCLNLEAIFIANFYLFMYFLFSTENNEYKTCRILKLIYENSL